MDPTVDQIVDFTPYKEGPAFAIGLLSIDSYLGKHSCNDIVLENYFDCDWNDIESRLRNTHPDLIGISCTSDSRGFCWRLPQLAKKSIFTL